MKLHIAFPVRRQGPSPLEECALVTGCQAGLYGGLLGQARVRRRSLSGDRHIFSCKLLIIEQQPEGSGVGGRRILTQSEPARG
jgi:hypothetical protein